MEQNSQEDILREYLRVIFSHKAVIITTVITVMVFIFIGLELKTPTYVAHVKMLISAKKQIESPYYMDFSRQEGISVTQSNLVSSYPVLERVVKELNLDNRPSGYEKQFCSTLKAYLIDLRLRKIKSEHYEHGSEKEYLFRRAIETLKKNINISTIRNTDLFTINVTDFDPQIAAKIANSISRSYVIFDLEQQLAEVRLKYGMKHSLVLQLYDNINLISKNINGELLTSNIDAIGPASVKIIEQAHVPFRRKGKRKLVIVILGCFMSVFLGFMLAFVFNFLDHRFKTPEDAEKLLNIPYIGFLPKTGFKIGEIIGEKKVAPLVASSYKKITEKIYLCLKDRNKKSIMITAASFAEGSSTIAANIACCLANDLGNKTLIVDGNLNNPVVHKLFNIPCSPGLMDLIDKRNLIDDAIQNISPNLSVLPAGKKVLNPVSILKHPNAVNAFKGIKDKFDFIIFDNADLLCSGTVSSFLSHVDGVVLVVSGEKNRRQIVNTALEHLQPMNGNIFGFIYNNRRFTIPKTLYKMF